MGCGPSQPVDPKAAKTKEIARHNSLHNVESFVGAARSKLDAELQERRDVREKRREERRKKDQERRKLKKLASEMLLKPQSEPSSSAKDRGASAPAKPESQNAAESPPPPDAIEAPAEAAQAQESAESSNQMTVSAPKKKRDRIRCTKLDSSGVSAKWKLREFKDLSASDQIAIFALDGESKDPVSAVPNTNVSREGETVLPLPPGGRFVLRYCSSQKNVVAESAPFEIQMRPAPEAERQTRRRSSRESCEIRCTSLDEAGVQVEWRLSKDLTAEATDMVALARAGDAPGAVVCATKNKEARAEGNQVLPLPGPGRYVLRYIRAGPPRSVLGESVAVEIKLYDPDADDVQELERTGTVIGKTAPTTGDETKDSAESPGVRNAAGSLDVICVDELGIRVEWKLSASVAVSNSDRVILVLADAPPNAAAATSASNRSALRVSSAVLDHVESGIYVARYINGSGALVVESTPVELLMGVPPPAAAAAPVDEDDREKAMAFFAEQKRKRSGDPSASCNAAPASSDKMPRIKRKKSKARAELEAAAQGLSEIKSVFDRYAAESGGSPDKGMVRIKDLGPLMNTITGTDYSSEDIEAMRGALGDKGSFFSFEQLTDLFARAGAIEQQTTDQVT